MPPTQTLEKPSVSSSSPSRRGAEPVSSGSMIRFQCGSCGERLSVPEKFAGRKGKCPGCGQLNRVPTAVEASQPAEILLPKKSPAPASIAPREPFTWSVPAPAPVSDPVQESPRADAEPEREVLSDPAQRYGMFTEVTQRPDRWTRGPLKLEEGEKAEHHGALFHRKPQPEDDGDIEITREWTVDRKRKLPKPVKIALLGLAVLGIIGAIWGIFYLLLTLIIKVNE